MLCSSSIISKFHQPESLPPHTASRHPQSGHVYPAVVQPLTGREDDNHLRYSVDLERKNFKKAGDVLAEIWSKMVLDGHGVTAQYVENESVSVDDIDEHWCASHCRVSQYLLQIVKCEQTT